MKKRPRYRSTFSDLKPDGIVRVSALANLEAAANLYRQDPCPTWHRRVGVCMQGAIRASGGVYRESCGHWHAP